MATRQQYGEHTDIEQDTLTDNSVAHNVLYVFDRANPEAFVRFGCTGEHEAHDLALILDRNAVWGEIG